MGVAFNDNFGTIAYNGVFYPVNNGSSGGSSLTNILYNVVKVSDSELRIKSYLWIAEELNINNITIENCTITNIIRENDFSIILYGDFSKLKKEEPINILTFAGFFIDKNASSNNSIFMQTVRKELEFTTAGELITTINGRSYTKYLDGLAIGGYIYGIDFGVNFTGPILISEFSGAASYTNSKENISYTNFEGNTWYYSGTQQWMSGNKNSTDGPALKLNNIPEIINKVKEGINIRDAILMYYRRII